MANKYYNQFMVAKIEGISFEKIIFWGRNSGDRTVVCVYNY